MAPSLVPESIDHRAETREYHMTTTLAKPPFPPSRHRVPVR